MFVSWYLVLGERIVPQPDSKPERGAALLVVPHESHSTYFVQSLTTQR